VANQNCRSRDFQQNQQLAAWQTDSPPQQRNGYTAAWQDEFQPQQRRGYTDSNEPLVHAWARGGFGDLRQNQPLVHARARGGYAAYGYAEDFNGRWADEGHWPRAENEHERAEAAAGVERQLELFNVMHENVANLAGLLRQIVHRLPAATPSEGSAEDPAAVVPLMDTSVTPADASFLPPVPAGFAQATPPKPTPEHHPPPPEEACRMNAPAHWRRTPLSGGEFEARAEPAVLGAAADEPEQRARANRAEAARAGAGRRAGKIGAARRHRRR